jgi:hypothetical protein
MKRLASFTVIAFAATAALAAASASAGTLVSASGPVTVDGKEVRLEAGKTLALQKGQVLDTRQATAVWRSETGDDVTIDPASVAKDAGVEAGAAGLFLSSGLATGVISDKTHLGASSGWASAPAGAKAKVLVEAPKARAANEALFRCVDGSAWVTYRSYTLALLKAHSVTLTIDPAAPGTFCFRTGQQNASEVEVRRHVAGGDILAYVPKATLGCVTDWEGDQTRVCDDVNSLKTDKIRLTTKFGGRTNNAEIGPGTCAVINNKTGSIRILFKAVQFEILERAIALTTEFSTLAQSNFADVTTTKK